MAGLVVVVLQAADDGGYAPAGACTPCHLEISKSYRETGMGRSISLPSQPDANGAYYHQLSDRSYRMEARGGGYYQRRWQVSPEGSEVNVLEKQVHLVMGSGNHARTYLHQTPAAELLQMPLSRYAENGGSFAMSPGYDRPNQIDFRRKITNDCLFCHAAYPPVQSDADLDSSPARGYLPRPIDCQRCHGPGRRHVQTALPTHILNPGRLSRDRQLDVCMQCHLEPTSRRLPHSLRRYGRGVFSYRPGEPLADYILYFDHTPGSGLDDKFEINHAAYRLRKSACFRSSGLTCTTCHNPHQALRGDAAVSGYRSACLNCHAAAHNRSQDCTACHMPKRRTEDVVHVVMTDHFIQRRAPVNPLAPLHEPVTDAPYTGEVRLYYPASAPELYLALAQVKDTSNLKDGIPRLRLALDRTRAGAEFYHELAQAYRAAGDTREAVKFYAESVRRKLDFIPAFANWSQLLMGGDTPDSARKVLDQGLAAAPNDPILLTTLAHFHLRLDRVADAIPLLEKAILADPDLPEAHNTLGAALLKAGRAAEAEAAYRHAILLQPDYAQAHSSLAYILTSRRDLARAQYHLELALRADDNNHGLHLNYAVTLAERGFRDRALEHLRRAATSPDRSMRDTALRLIRELTAGQR